MENIIEKIQKLLALANSSNENEAKLAAEKANELMLKYNIELTKVNSTTEYNQDVIETGSRIAPIDRYVANVVSKHFFVEIITIRKRSVWAPSTYELVMIGEKNNLATAKYVWSFLKNAFENCWQKYRKETNAPARVKLGYFLGLSQGLNEKLSAKRKEVEEKYAVVIVPDKGLDLWINKNIGRVRESGYTTNIYDRNAVNSGREDGAKINISKGLEGNSENSGKFLE